MRFTITAVLLIACVSAVKAEDIPAYRTEPLLIDAVLDEKVWQESVRVPIRYVGGKTKSLVAEDGKSHYMLAWDSNYFYVGYAYVGEKYATSYTTGRMTGPACTLKWDNPRWEMAIPGVPGPMHVFELNLDLHYDDNFAWELHHTPQDYWLTKVTIRPRDKDDPLWNLLQDGVGTDWRSPVVFVNISAIPDSPPYTMKTATRDTYEGKGDQRKYAGYTAEWRIPLRGLGAPVARRKGEAAFDLDGHRFRAAGCEWRLNGKNYHSVPDCDKAYFADVVLHGNHFVFKK